MQDDLYYLESSDRQSGAQHVEDDMDSTMQDDGVSSPYYGILLDSFSDSLFCSLDPGPVDFTDNRYFTYADVVGVTENSGPLFYNSESPDHNDNTCSEDHSVHFFSSSGGMNDRALEDERDDFRTKAQQTAGNLRQTYFGRYGERVDDPWNPLDRDALELMNNDSKSPVQANHKVPEERVADRPNDHCGLGALVYAEVLAYHEQNAVKTLEQTASKVQAMPDAMGL